MSFNLSRQAENCRDLQDETTRSRKLLYNAAGFLHTVASTSHLFIPALIDIIEDVPPEKWDIDSREKFVYRCKDRL